MSWIITTSTQSEHPDFMPAAGAAFVASKMNAIAANPEVWAKTAFILNYDENDGIFDHVAPPVPPPGTPKEFVKGLPDRRRLSRPVHHRVAVDRRRLGVQPAVRPHFGAAVPGEVHRRRRAQHQRLEAQNLWRSDRRVPLRGKAESTAALPNTTNTLNLARYESAYLPKPKLPGAAQHSRRKKKAIASTFRPIGIKPQGTWTSQPHSWASIVRNHFAPCAAVPSLPDLDRYAELIDRTDPSMRSELTTPVW